ncbi:MAG TPA: glucoamylase family protein [Flavisolibacter sp.]|nr:glucoamylase family protein [Flavisolibacter sp.]
MKSILFSFFLLISYTAITQEFMYDYVFFANSRMKGDYFFSKTSSSGSSTITNNQNKLLVSQQQFFTPGNSLFLEYTNGVNGNWEAIIYKDQLRGQDHFKKPGFLSLWMFVSTGKTTAAGLPFVQLMMKDSSLTKKIPVTSKKYNSWEAVIISLTDFAKEIQEASDVIGVVFSQKGKDGNKHRVFIDDIEFIVTKKATLTRNIPTILETTGFAKHVDLQWEPIKDSTVRYVKIYRSEDGKTFKPVGIQLPFHNRYADFTGKTGKSYQYKISVLNHQYVESKLSAPISAKTKTMNDDELLTMVQEASFRYYWDGAEPNSGLAKENIPGRHNMVASGASGFGILALIVGTERKFITRVQAIERFKKIVDFLERTETFHGAFSHFIDGPTGKAEPFFGKRDNGGDLVETSFLLQGLLAARAYFNGNSEDEKTIRDKITGIWQKVEWNWYKQYPDSKFLFWHWSPDQGWIINHNLIGWNETMVTYLLAIASPTHPVPASMYYTGWANQDSTGQQYRSAWGGTKDGSMYSNGNNYYGIKLDVGVSNGGPLFFTHYSYLGYDPHLITDKYTNYFSNNKNIALINHKYCIDNPGNYKGYGDSCWGLTASDGPYNYSADEPVLRQDRGKIAPTGAVSSFPYTPAESMKAVKNYYYNYGSFLWGEYGFRDAFNLTQNWCSEIYMGLNQAPMTVMIENYRTGLLWKLFMSDKDIQNGLQKLDEETKKESRGIQ